jgi:AAA15 family ATPase/GTPase
MITRLSAKNFKSWKDTGELQLSPLTGLFGTNSSGKTSILQLLLMLKQTVESPDRKRVIHTGDNRSLVDLGTFFDLIHGHQTEASLDIALSWDLPTDLVVNDPQKKSGSLFQSNQLSFDTSIREESNGEESKRAVVEKFSYHFESYAFGMERRKSEKDQAKVTKPRALKVAPGSFLHL